MPQYNLKISNRLTGITLHQDPKYPTMFRIHANDGRVSDMVNLTRAKDAALAWARQLGLRTDTLDIKWEYGESPLEAQAAE